MMFSFNIPNAHIKHSLMQRFWNTNSQNPFILVPMAWLMYSKVWSSCYEYVFGTIYTLPSEVEVTIQLDVSEDVTSENKFLPYGLFFSDWAYQRPLDAWTASKSTIFMYWFTYFSAVVQMSSPYEQFSDPNIHKQFKNNRTKLVKPKLFGNKHEHLSVWFLLILHECMVIIELALQNVIFVMIKDKNKEPELETLWAIYKHFVEKSFTWWYNPVCYKRVPNPIPWIISMNTA